MAGPRETAHGGDRQGGCNTGGGVPTPATRSSLADRGKTPCNDGGFLIAHNIITDLGRGRTRWIWGEDGVGCPIRFTHGQVPENPPLADALIQGNFIYDNGPRWTIPGR